MKLMDYKLECEIEETIRKEPIERHTLDMAFARLTCDEHDWHQDNEERVCVNCGRHEYVRIPCPGCSELTQRLYEVWGNRGEIFVGCYRCYVAWGTKAAKALEYYEAHLKRQAKKELREKQRSGKAAV